MSNYDNVVALQNRIGREALARFYGGMLLARQYPDVVQQIQDGYFADPNLPSREDGEAAEAETMGYILILLRECGFVVPKDEEPEA